MRNLSIFLTVFLFSLSIFSQQIPTTKIDSMLINVDKTELTSQLLYERAVPWASLNTFNANENLANASYFEQAVLEMRKAAKDSLFPPLAALKGQYISDTIYDRVQLGILNTVFHTVNYNNDQESLGGLRMVNDQFEELNNGKPLFEEHHALVISPTKTYLQGETITFIVDENIWFQEAGDKEMVSLTANFETSQDFQLISNGTVILQQVPVQYTQEGYKTLTFEATFADGTSQLTQAVVHVKLPAPPPQQGVSNLIEFTGTIPFQGYDEASTILGKLVYKVFYGNSQNKILKPIIIIDGFDPGDKRKIQDMDSNLPNDDHHSIEEMMTFTNNSGTPIELIPLLRTQGYDVIIVNHPTYYRNGNLIDGGADYIERNAFTHVDFYQYINSQLVQNGSDEKLVIIGPSMGGQISRYALAYMEKHALDHNTRLWISIDSPHLGANIPIGLQSMLYQLALDNGAAQNYVYKQLRSPAAKQQLIEQFHSTAGNNITQQYLNGKTISQGFNTNKGHPFFQYYYNNLFNNGLSGSKGYPQNLRKIALVNGSLEGNKRYESPWTQELEYFLAGSEIGFNARAFQDLWGTGSIHIGSLEAYAMPLHNSYNKVSRYKKHFTDKSKYASNLNARGSLDQVPGGWFPGFQEMADAVEGTDPITSGSFWGLQGALTTVISIFSDLLGGAEASVYDNERVHSFIPVVSALGFLNPTVSWTQEMDRNLSCTNEIPFDTYFGGKYNEQHTSFNQESINWLFKELGGDPQQPSIYYDGEDIEGPDTICSTDIVTYEIPGNCQVTPEEWEVSNNLNIITQTPSSVTVQPVNSQLDTSGYIRAIFPYETVQKDIWLGRADSPTFINGPTSVHTGSMQSYTGGGSEGATSYKWLLPYPFDPAVDIRNPIDLTSNHWQMWPTNSGFNSHVFTGNGGYDGLIQLIAVNSCGDGGSFHIEVEHDNSGTCTTCYDPVIPYPNAAYDEFTLDFSDYPEKEYLIVLYDQYANTVYNGSAHNIEKTINTLSLPNGTYFLHIHEDDNVTIKQLMIQH